MKRFDKKEIATMVRIIGEHIVKYWIMMLIILALVSCFAVGFMIVWYVVPDEVPLSHEIGFYVGQSLLLLVSLAAIAILLLGRKGLIKVESLTVIFHIYASLLMTWGTLLFVFDLSLGFPEIVYLLIYTIIAGLFVIEPIYYCAVALASLATIIVVAILHPNMLFKGNWVVENIINIVAFVLSVITIASRNYRVTISEFKQARKLEELSYKDELTGLLNERSYINAVEDIDKEIKEGKDVKFAVILMDVNNLKATNDAYGHRFGCSLIVRCGHTLPTLFNSSLLFHVGGDEFIAIVMGEDFDKFEETMKRFDDTMLYSLVDYEGVELIFSVARGYSIYQKGQFYKDVLQIADKAMYENKTYLKEKYHMQKR